MYDGITEHPIAYSRRVYAAMIDEIEGEGFTVTLEWSFGQRAWRAVARKKGTRPIAAQCTACVPVELLYQRWKETV